MKLTQEQLQVVHHPLGQHARVLAVAGSGKSTTMAHRGILCQYVKVQIPCQYMDYKIV